MVNFNKVVRTNEGTVQIDSKGKFVVPVAFVSLLLGKGNLVLTQSFIDSPSITEKVLGEYISEMQDVTKLTFPLPECWRNVQFAVCNYDSDKKWTAYSALSSNVNYEVKTHNGTVLQVPAIRLNWVPEPGKTHFYRGTWYETDWLADEKAKDIMIRYSTILSLCTKNAYWCDLSAAKDTTDRNYLQTFVRRGYR